MSIAPAPDSGEDLIAPEAMIEAAARSRCERESGPFGVTWDDEDLGDYRAQLLAAAAEDLAAALGVCEVLLRIGADGTVERVLVLDRLTAPAESGGGS